MTTLHVVCSSTGNTPHEGDSSVRVIGAYTDPNVAAAVAKVAWGVGATVTEVTVDHIDPDLLRAMAALGIELGGPEQKSNSEQAASVFTVPLTPEPALPRHIAHAAEAISKNIC